MKRERKRGFLENLIKHRVLLLFMIPGLIALIVFNYVPMYGLVLAFKDYKIKKGILGSPWVGLKWIRRVVEDPYMLLVLKNTLRISITKLIVGFPVPILFAIMLNEVRNLKFKKITQTVSYLPNFISWVVLSGVFFSIFSVNGPINAIRGMFGKEPFMFLGNASSFFVILILTDVWKGFGWGSIIYFAAICGIDPGLYESARMDGANRRQCARHITLPCLVPVITIQLTLSIGGLLGAGFDQIINMYNSSVMRTADIIDTYVYRMGVLKYEYSYSTAVGLLNSLVSVTLIALSTRAAKAMGNDYTLW